MLGLSGAPDRRVPAAVAAPLDRHSGQELQVAHAKGLHGLPCHRRDVPLAGPGKRNSILLCLHLPHMSERNRRSTLTPNHTAFLSISLFLLSSLILTVYIHYRITDTIYQSISAI